MKRKLKVDSYQRTELVHYISDGTKESEHKVLELIRSDIDLEHGANPNAETLMGASSLQFAVVRCKKLCT